MKKRGLVTLVVMNCLLGLSLVGANPVLTIREIQETDDPNGSSSWNGDIVDCNGGIVVFKREAKKPRLILADPNAGNAWGGIQVKGWSPDAFAEIAIGDWVSLKNVLVEENVGTTFLQYNASFMKVTSELTVINRNNPLPRPVVVEVSDIAAPEYDAATDVWGTPQKSAEPYESMVVQVRDVWVASLDLGAKNDNYALQPADRGEDPHQEPAECWVADYLNRDGDRSEDYMPLVALDASFCAVTGLLEQYTRLDEGYDLYQLLTLSHNSFVEYNAADLDGDCDVDLWDAQMMTAQLLGQDAGLEGDLNGDTVVDNRDQGLFETAWQAGDLNGDGVVDGDDLNEWPL